MHVRFVLPDGRIIQRLIAFHQIPQPNTIVDLEGGRYRVIAVNMTLTQENAEAQVLLATAEAPAQK
jgi:hypothetical protein